MIDGFASGAAKPELLPLKSKKARRDGLFCSELVAGYCLQSRDGLGVLQRACLERSRSAIRLQLPDPAMVIVARIWRAKWSSSVRKECAGSPNFV